MLKLYWTPSLPAHYVAEDAAGDCWILPVDPLDYTVWQQRRPYHGNYTLRRLSPSIEQLYQQDAS